MRKTNKILLVLLLIFSTAKAQDGNIDFRKLNIETGLHDGTVRGIGQDKFGYIWIATVGALNRLDGKNVVQFTNIPGDSSSSYGSQPRTVFSDKKGRLWIGYETGLVQYDFNTSTFKKVASLAGEFVNKITDCGDTALYLATRRGFVRLNTETGAAFFYAKSPDPRHAALHNNATFNMAAVGDTIYITTQQGLVAMKLSTGNTQRVIIPALEGMPLYAIANDDKGNLWLGIHNRIKLVKYHIATGELKIYDQYLSADINTQPLNVMDILVDSHQRVWVVTAIDGLLQYNANSDSFTRRLHNDDLPSSPADNGYRCIFQDAEGVIWMGCDYSGVAYFEPDKTLFKTIFPFADRLDERSRKVARAVTEDKEGNLWMGTHDGVSRLNITTNKYTVWRNSEKQKPVLYNNIVRSMYCDADNNVWIGTASGVNRYNNATGQMEFIDTKYLPYAFYNSITPDKSGNTWFCTNDTASLYWYNTATKTYHNISEHPQLKKYTRFAPACYLLEDSRQRLWISFSRNGVLMLDKHTGVAQLYNASQKRNHRIAGDQVEDIKEDRNGNIWLSCFNGISGIDTNHDSVISFNNKNGLPGNWVGCLEVDQANRLWLGVNGGLTMLDDKRKNFTYFTLSDGLPSLGFPEHAAITTSNGDIIMPTYNGFIRFNPLKYKKEKNTFRWYLSNYSVFNKNTGLSLSDTSGRLTLKADENSFTFNLVALNYINPSETWFAYKLENFDKDWHYTKDPKAVYTNIPGGHYIFFYKASGSNDGWKKIGAKKITINLQTVFYKSAWFLTLMTLLLGVAFYLFYQYRIRQQKQLYTLKSKAELLEKEKTLIQYESLKQQLNPHFLFNSLTSLRSLIKTDSKTAAKFLDGMSKIYRYILKSGAQELVVLQDELDFVKTFAELQQVRFGSGLEVSIDIEEADTSKLIAPVVLQNLVENAIKHNTTSTDQPLIIDIFSEDGYIVVRNTLQQYRMVETSNKSGLISLQKLYGFYTDKKIDITINAHFFTVRIPLL